jgi:hypothetical protein
MRRVSVDAARARAAGKRRRSRVCVTFAETRLADPRAALDFDMLALNEVLTRLAAVDDRKARVVELRFFGGLNVEENGPYAWHLHRNRSARLADRQDLAASRDGPRGRIMSDERWIRIDRLLQSALGRPPSDREAFIRAPSRADDEGVRDEVLSLLAHAGILPKSFWRHAPEAQPLPTGAALGAY